MGIKERKQRQRHQLREGILSAARDIARREGWRAVTIRKIAAAIEYSPPVIYEYFDSKDEILLELVRQGYAEQLEAVERAARSAGDPEAAVREVGRAWLDFAFGSPDLYQVMYGLGGVSFTVAELEREGEKIADVIGHVVGEFLKQNGKPAEDVPEKVMALWGTAHGLVSLAMAGRVAGGDEAAVSLADRAAGDYLTAWREA